jgi:CRISPR/Cas system-associated exonuclease Cas4 (RecB family)
MPEIDAGDSTLSYIFQTYKNDANRKHLGASQIGAECPRKLWYSFRWCLNPNFEPRMLRLFETGKLEEIRVIKNLKDAGIRVWEVDPETGMQFKFEMFGGHFSGSLDGVGKEFPEAPKTPHVIEIKTASDRRFKDLQKKGLKEAKPEHYAQVILYMHALKLTRAMYICVNKNTDDIYIERVYEDKIYAEELIQKAEVIIFSEAPPERIADTEGRFVCKFCEFKPLCWQRELDVCPEINCRTCCHSTPLISGEWECAKKYTVDESKSTCISHVFIPDLLPFEVEDADGENCAWVKYTNGLINGPKHTQSVDLKNL